MFKMLHLLQRLNLIMLIDLNNRRVAILATLFVLSLSKYAIHLIPSNYNS